MPASVNDKFRKGYQAFSTTLASTKASGASSMSLSSATGLPTDTALDFTVGRVDSSGTSTPATKVVYKGTLSGTTVSNLTVVEGTDQSHAAGAVVELTYTASTHNDAIDGILADHSQSGGHEVATNYDPSNPTLETQKWVGVASAVNEPQTTNSATGNAVIYGVSGGDTNIDLNLKPKGTGKVSIGTPALAIYPFDFVSSGCVWTGDSLGASLAASMTAGVVVINGTPVSISAVTARAFTASKDTYVDVGVDGVVDYPEVANNAASPALAANHMRIAIIVTDGTDIQDAGSVNQGQETKILPIASSTPYAVTDSLGNLICPRDPQRRILGYRQIISGFSTAATSATAVTGLSVPVIIPTNRKVKITIGADTFHNDGGGGVSSTTELHIYEGATLNALTTALHRLLRVTIGGTYYLPVEGSVIRSTSGTVFFTVSLHGSSGAQSNTVNAGAPNPAFIRVELV